MSPTSGRTSGWLPATDMPRYVRELCDFVGFGEAAAATVRESAPVVLEREAELTGALYEHFLKFPESVRFFLGADGAPDAARIERRKHSLGRWLRETAQAAVTQESSYYLLAVGLSHSHRATGPGGVVPAHRAGRPLRGGAAAAARARGQRGVEQAAARAPQRVPARLPAADAAMSHGSWP